MQNWNLLFLGGWDYDRLGIHIPNGIPSTLAGIMSSRSGTFLVNSSWKIFEPYSLYLHIFPSSSRGQELVVCFAG